MRRKSWRFLSVVTLVTATLGGYRPASAGGSPGSSWQVQNPRFPLVGLQTVACPSPTVCLAAGEDRIFSTADGGTTWRHRRVDRGSQIEQVVCVSPSSCFVLDQAVQGRTVQEVMVRTQDGGHTWTDVSKFPQTFLGGASCPTPTVCYTIGGKVPGLAAPVHLWRSDDGGVHWVRLNGQSLYIVATQSLTCPGSALCYLGGNGSIVVTRDGGRTWSKRAFPTGRTAPGAPTPERSVTGISCVGADRCYAVMGNGRVMGTRDGWATSRELRPGDPPGRPPFSRITCPAPSVCYVSGYSGTILATTTGGASWKALETSSSNGVQAVACSTPSDCTAVGGPTTILTTRDGGATWHSGFPGTTNLLSAVSCVDASTCTAVGAAGAILDTTNGGRTWKLEASGSHQSLDAVSCPTAAVCYAVGGSRYVLSDQGPVAAGSVGPVILRTADGGTSWTVLARKPIAGRPLDLAGIACPAEQICYATGDSGAILSTTDGGRSWQWGRTGTYFQLRGIACPTTTHCLAVGGLDAECGDDGCNTPEEGVIFATQDGGRTWQRRFYRRTNVNGPSATGAHLLSISCPDPTTCFAAGHNIVVKTIDGGHTWRPATTSPTAPPGGGPWATAVSLACPSSSMCWASFGSPMFMRTEDGGRTWTISPANPILRAGPVLGLTCPTLNACYAVGGSGLILRLMATAKNQRALIRPLSRLPAARTSDAPDTWAVTPGQTTQDPTRAPLAQGWSMGTMPARKDQWNPAGDGPPYSIYNGAPGWLLTTRRGLVAMSRNFDRGPQRPPNEWLSTNGRTWQQIALPSSVFGQDSVEAVAAGRPGLAAVGVRFNSVPSVTSRPAAWFSPDGRTWRRAAPVGRSLASGEMLAVTATGTGFIAVGDIAFPGDELSPPSDRMAVWTSPGGGRWQLVSGNSPVFQNAIASVILHSGAGLIALGTSRNLSGPGSMPAVIVWASRDGRVWRRVPQAPGVFPTTDVQLQGAVEARGRYVAWARTFTNIPHDLVWTSTDGLNWRQAPGIHFQYGLITAIVAYGTGFVALGTRDREPTLWSSADGIHWAPRVGEDVFGGGDTQLAGATDWKDGLVVVGSYLHPVPFDPAPSAGYAPPLLVYRPAAWLWRPGTRSRSHPQWPRTDPKWFRLRIEDLPPGFSPFGGGYPFGGYFYGIGCAQPPASATTVCPNALAALGPSLAFGFQFPYGGAGPGQPAPYVSGFAILTGSPARARSAFGYAGGLASTVDPNDVVRPRLIRSLDIGRGPSSFR